MLSRGVLVGVCVAISLGVMACGGDEPGGKAPEDETSSAPALQGPLVYTRAGGLAGRIERLEVAPDGRAKLSAVRGKSRTFSLAPAELDRLKQLVASADLASVEADSAPSRPVPDGISQRIEYGGRTVTTADGGGSTPESIGPLIGRMSSLVDRYAGRG